MDLPQTLPAAKSPSLREGRLVRRLPRLSSLLLTGVLLVFTALVLIPFVWMILMSVRTTGEILNHPYGLPSVIHWQNYLTLFFDPEIAFYRYFYNSIFVTFFALLLTCFLSTLAGYGFGRPRYQFKFRGWLFAL